MPDALGFSETEAARMLGLHATTLRRYRRDRKIAYLELPGGRIRYTAEHLAKFKRSIERQPLA